MTQLLTVLGLYYLGGAVVCLWVLIGNYESVRDTNLEFEPPLRFWLLHTLAWPLEIALFFYEQLTGDTRPHRWFNRVALPRKYRTRRRS